MSDSANYLEILFFAAIAAILVFRLRSVLGKRTGHEGPPARFGKEEPTAPANGAGNVITLPERTKRGEEEDAAAGVETEAASKTALIGIAAIRRADASFDPVEFLEGARGAFEMIVQAFAEPDLETLENLLNQEMFRSFKEAVEERRKAQQTLSTTIVSIVRAEISDASLQHRTAYVSVTFVSEQIKLLKDAEGRILEGDPSQPETITDVWTFARNTRATDPNWTLVRTEAGE